MNRLAVKMAYLGDGFSGSQAQPGVRTVAGDVLQDLLLVTRSSEDALDLSFSSRTDAGVNALGNVFAVRTELNGAVLLKALDAVSDRVFYRSYCEVDDSFNVRHASSRTYRYVLPAEGRDAGLMRECTKLFEGEHDFIRFCRPDGKRTVLTLDRADIEQSGDIVILEFESRYFLWNMIRRMVAAIDSVGRGRSSVLEVEETLNGTERTFGLAPPDALTLLDVSYAGLDFIPVTTREFNQRKKNLLLGCRMRKEFLESLRACARDSNDVYCKIDGTEEPGCGGGYPNIIVSIPSVFSGCYVDRTLLLL